MGTVSLTTSSAEALVHGTVLLPEAGLSVLARTQQRCAALSAEVKALQVLAPSSLLRWFTGPSSCERHPWKSQLSLSVVWALDTVSGYECRLLKRFQTLNNKFWLGQEQLAARELEQRNLLRSDVVRAPDTPVREQIAVLEAAVEAKEATISRLEVLSKLVLATSADGGALC